ncbi:MAG: ATP synthase F1 subunit delta [Pirellulales bacterium]|nr:ATP synthase F1 subunit delta [Pirellulales bacterium]
MAASKRKINVLDQQVGTVYSKALYDAADAKGQIEAIVEEFASLLNDVLDEAPGFEKLLASEMVSGEEKRDVVDRVFRGKASPLMLNFLKVLSTNERLGYLRAIQSSLIELHDTRRGRVRVDVTTAAPLADGVGDKIKDRVRSMLGSEPELVTATDPSLIGGIQLRVGDTVYDGSVKTQLRQLRAQFHQRNVEEIETNRERFQFKENAL